MHGNSRHAAPRPAPARGRTAQGSTAPGRTAPGRTAPAAADVQRLADLLAPAVTAMGLDLEGITVGSAGRRRLLRVVVDRDGGVGLDDIALASRELSARLDAAAAMGDAPYTLEVSSPGVDRPLTEPRHWRRAAGRLVTVPVLTGQESETGSRPAAASIEGRIAGADEAGVRIEAGGQIRQFGYAELGPGRVQVEFAPLPGSSGNGTGAETGRDAGEETEDGY
jgi:ribosome maturation factor RimP